MYPKAIVYDDTLAAPSRHKVMPIFQAALNEKVVALCLSDSNSAAGGIGWYSGIGAALQARYGLYSSLMLYMQPYPGTPHLTESTGAPAIWHNLAGKTDGTSYFDATFGLYRRQGYTYSANADVNDVGALYFQNSIGGDFLMDFNYSDAIRIHFSYGGGMGAGSSFDAQWQTTGTGGTTGSGGIFSCTPGTLGTLKYGSFDLAAQAGRTGVQLYPGRFGSMLGPFFMDMVWVERFNATKGFLFQPMVGYGGHGLIEMYNTAMDAGAGKGNPSIIQFIKHLCFAANGLNTKFLIWTNSGLNDLNAAARGQDPSAAAFATNLQTMTTWWENRFADAGINKSQLYFIHCPSHVISDPPDVNLTAYRDAAEDVAFAHPRSSSFDFSKITSYQEMLMNAGTSGTGMYISGTNDTAHLTEFGYRKLGLHQFDQYYPIKRYIR